MPTITRITFSKLGCIQVKFVATDKSERLPQDYEVQWGVVALHPWQAEEAAKDHGWENLGNSSDPKYLEQGLVEVKRSMMAYTRKLAEHNEEQTRVNAR